MPMTPNGRRQFAEDIVKQMGKYITPVAETPEQKLAHRTKRIWDKITNQVAVPLLQALRTPNDYQPAGTQVLLRDSFMLEFNQYSKDDLVNLLSIMHAEELEKTIDQEVRAGNVGENFGKPV